MGNILYLECNNGISGDMTVAALLDLGADEEGLLKALKSIPSGGFEVSISTKMNAGLACKDFDVILDKENENHDHDMEYLYGHEHGGKLISDGGHEYGHRHSHGHGECGDCDGEHGHGECENESDGHEHGHSHGGHIHRNLADILDILEATDISRRAKDIAFKVFDLIAEAEALAHGQSKDKVHFHEVGAIDSIVDVIAVAYCIDNLGIEDVIVPYLSEGQGSVRCAHGIMSVPVPAVVNIVSNCGIVLKKSGYLGELVTPTGAAIVGALRTRESLPDSYKLLKAGMSAGKRALRRKNDLLGQDGVKSILRAFLLEDKSLVKGDFAEEEADWEEIYECERDESEDLIYKLETNIDDSSGQQMGYVMDRLMRAGARDVYFVPIYMKKNRPAHELNVICKRNKIRILEDIIFRDTTSIGIRRMCLNRTILQREIVELETEFGMVRFKKCILGDGEERLYPEYDDISRIARENDLAYEDVLRRLISRL